MATWYNDFDGSSAGGGPDLHKPIPNDDRLYADDDEISFARSIQPSTLNGPTASAHTADDRADHDAAQPGSAGPFSPISPPDPLVETGSPRPTGPRTPTSPEHAAAISNASTTPAHASPSVSTAPTATIPMSFANPSWRIHSAGHLWRILEYFHLRGHVSLTSEEVEHIRTLVPALQAEQDPLPAMLATLQTVSCTRGARETFELWSAREGTPMPMSGPRWHRLAPAVQPWEMSSHWSAGLWSVAVYVTGSFLMQHLPVSEPDFRGSFAELYAHSGLEGWNIDVVIYTLYYLRNAPWYWPVLFRARE